MKNLYPVRIMESKAGFKLKARDLPIEAGAKTLHAAVKALVAKAEAFREEALAGGHPVALPGRPSDGDIVIGFFE